MTKRAGQAGRAWMFAGALLLLPVAANAQALLRPADRPIVTAENERWYLEGQPITYAGSIFYPAGAAVFFNAFEMARTGDYRGIPIYVLSTRDAYSVVFVPVGRGMMQPYERPREGDVAGTVGNAAPSFPVDRDIEGGYPDAGLQAAAPPVVGGYRPGYDALPSYDRPVAPRSATVGTSGTVAAVVPAGPLTTALKPTGLNAFYIQYDGQRYYSAGPVVSLEPASFTRAGEYHGFPVYTSRDHAGLIYVAVANDATGLLAPYSTQK